MNLNANHIVIYYDAETDERDGEGWCVESSDSEMTVRFGTLAGALAYASTEENWLRKTPKRVVI
jgi:hypothetical protein